MISILRFVINHRVLILCGSFVLALTLASTISYVKGRNYEKRVCIAENTKVVIENAKKDAVKWANRPRTVDDAIKRLRRAADERRADNP